jgi:RNA polymerase subunit RPABC4/transcription elongation factor Spt4
MQRKSCSESKRRVLMDKSICTICNKFVWRFTCVSEEPKQEERDFMAEAVPQPQHDFWRPPVRATETPIKLERAAACSRCGTEFIVGSEYCHSCGVKRPLNSAAPFEMPGLAELSAVAEHLELTVPALAAFLLGALCIVGAIAVSVCVRAKTPLDWQAIQLWRIEWLVAAIAAFVGGCLLKK